MTCRGLGRDITDEKMAAVTQPLVPAVGIALSTLTCVIYCLFPPHTCPHVLVPRGVSLSGVVAHGPHIRAFAGLPELSRGAGVADMDLACGGPALTLTPALPCVEVADRSSWEREGSRRAADFRGGVRWHVLAQNSGRFLTYFVKHFLPEYLILLTSLTPHSPK